MSRKRNAKSPKLKQLTEEKAIQLLVKELELKKEGITPDDLRRLSEKQKDQIVDLIKRLARKRSEKLRVIIKRSV